MVAENKPCCRWGTFALSNVGSVEESDIAKAIPIPGAWMRYSSVATLESFRFEENLINSLRSQLWTQTLGIVRPSASPSR